MKKLLELDSNNANPTLFTPTHCSPYLTQHLKHTAIDAHFVNAECQSVNAQTSLTIRSLFLLSTWFFFSLFTQNAIAKHDCEIIAGKWETKRYDDTLKAYTITNASYLENGSWSFTTVIDGDLLNTVHSESGRWECDGFDFVMHTEKIGNDENRYSISHKYKILDLDDNLFRFEATTENCSVTISDCNGTIFESTRKKNKWLIKGRNKTQAVPPS